MWKPTTLLISSVLPICAPVISTTVSIFGSLTASIMPRWYSARLVDQRPASALLSLDNWRYLSAHSLTVNFGGGFRLVRAASLSLVASFFACALRIVSDQFIQCLCDCLLK